MPTTHMPRKAPTGQYRLAIVLLLGILILAYGVFAHSRVGLYAGLAVTAAGVLVGIVRIVAPPRG